MFFSMMGISMGVVIYIDPIVCFIVMERLVILVLTRGEIGKSVLLFYCVEFRMRILFLVRVVTESGAAITIFVTGKIAIIPF
jgi:hypothetical protein